MWNEYDVGAYDRQHMEALMEEATRERLAKECQSPRKGLLQTVRDAAERLMPR